MATLTPEFSSERMVRQYVEGLYAPVAADYRMRLADQCRVGIDVQRWREQGRTDILKWAGTAADPSGQTVYRMWVSPGTCRVAEKCPFLIRVPHENRWKCGIQDTKPQICRSYPMSRKHALMTGCPGFEK